MIADDLQSVVACQRMPLKGDQVLTDDQAAGWLKCCIMRF
jgi:hypothetical protein